MFTSGFYSPSIFLLSKGSISKTHSLTVADKQLLLLSENFKGKKKRKKPGD